MPIFIGPHGCLKMPKMSDMWQHLMLPHHPSDIIMMSSCQLYDLYGQATLQHVGLPCGTPILPIFAKLQTIITFSYKLCLRQFLSCWKYIVEIYAMKSFSRASKKINFLIILDPPRSLLSILDPPGSHFMHKKITNLK